MGLISKTTGGVAGLVGAVALGATGPLGLAAGAILGAALNESDREEKENQARRDGFKHGVMHGETEANRRIAEMNKR